MVWLTRFEVHLAERAAHRHGDGLSGDGDRRILAVVLERAVRGV